LNLRKKMDGMKIVNNEFMKLLNLKKWNNRKKLNM
jgi:hypothetical protein